MSRTRIAIRLFLTLACASLLAVSGCVMAYHDGLPAWTTPEGGTEGSIGFHQVFGPGSEGSFWYLTPGGRVGFGRPPLAADFGLTSAVTLGTGWDHALLGPTLGVGVETGSFCFAFRPSAYLVSITRGGVGFGARWQVSMLAGNSVQSGRTHFSGGFRFSELGAGPVLLLDHNLGSVNLRLEGSYIMPYDYDSGQLTGGLTVAAPAPGSEIESGMWGY